MNTVARQLAAPISIAVLVATLAVLSPTPRADAAPVALPASVTSGLGRLQRDVAALAGQGGLAGVAAQQSVADVVASTAQALGAGKLCASVGLLQQLRILLATVAEVLGAPTVGTLVADVVSLVAALLGDTATAACGGATGAASPKPQRAVAIRTSNADRLRMTVAFPTPTFSSETAGGTAYLRMDDPGMGLFGAPVGSPELPNSAIDLAVPVGAGATVNVVGTTGYQLNGVKAWPAQPPALAAGDDPRFPTPPFTMNPAAYSGTALRPSTLATITQPTPMRDLQVSTVHVTAAQYAPTIQTLRIITSIDLDITFTGANTRFFGNLFLLDPFEQDAQPLYSSLVNIEAVKATLRPEPTPYIDPTCGEELLIISAIDLADQARRLANVRNETGTVTKVVERGAAGVGSTNDEIRDFIDRERRTPGCIHPSYVLLVGIAAGSDGGIVVPTFVMRNGPNDTGLGTASDLPYALLHQGSAIRPPNYDYKDLRPDLAVSRISGNRDEVTKVIDKTISYQQRAASSSDFYATSTVATGFTGCNRPPCRMRSTEDQEPFLAESVRAAATIDFATPTVEKLVGWSSDDLPER